jgi:PAS domain S-box-containing protein
MIKTSQKPVSMSRRLALALALTTTFVVILVAGGFYGFTASGLEKTFERKVVETLAHLDGTLAPLMWNFDHDTATRVAQTVLQGDLVIGLNIRDEGGRRIFSGGETNGNEELVRTQPIHFQDAAVGEMEVRFSRASLTDTLSEILWIGLLIWALSVVSIIVLTDIFIRKFFRRPLAAFTELAQSYRQHPEAQPSSTTPFLEFAPIEEAVRELASDVLTQVAGVRESEAYYRSIFETALYGIAVTGPNFNFTRVNDAFCKLIGYSEDELIDKMTVADVTLPDGYPDTRNRLEELIRGELTQFIFEKRYKTKTGDIVEAMTFVKGIYDEEGGYLGNAATILDITERKKLELAQKDSEARYRRIFESVEDGYILSDMNGVIQSVNPATAKMLNYDAPSQLVGKNIARDVYADEGQREALKEAVVEQGSVKGYRVDFRQRDGGVILGEANVHLVFDVAGLPVAMEGTFRDVTERIRAEKELELYRDHLETAIEERTRELAENEEKYRDLYENSPECLMSVDVKTGRIVECNSRVPEMTGYSREDIIGRELFYMYDAAYRDRAHAAFETLQREGEVHGVELKVLRADGSTFDVLLDAAGFYDTEGNLRFTRSSWRDISQRIEFEKSLQEANQRLRELDQMKSMFIASVSHELRTPLNSIIGFSGMILNGMSGDLNEEQRDGLDRVNRAGKHLLSLVSDVIDISKIEAGRVDRALVDFSLEDVIEEAVNVIQPQFMAKGLDLSLDAPSWPDLHTDRKRLYQCLLNYLSNAVKYTETGAVTLAVRDAGKTVDILVKDTGIGIAPDEIERLFAPFERLDSPLQIKAGGAGLGLYLTKKIATEILEGNVSVESRPGEGSVFGLHIPKQIDISES